MPRSRRTLRLVTAATALSLGAACGDADPIDPVTRPVDLAPAAPALADTRARILPSLPIAVQAPVDAALRELTAAAEAGEEAAAAAALIELRAVVRAEVRKNPAAGPDLGGVLLVADLIAELQTRS